MKKTIAIILSLVTILCLVACGDKDNPKDDNPTNTPQSVGQEEENKQAMWEKVFSEGTFTLNGDSFEMRMDDLMTIKVLADSEGKAFMSVSSESLGMGVSLYQKDAETAYFNRISSEEGVEHNEWYLCEITSDEDSATLDSTISDSSSTEDATELLNSIEIIKYIETTNGLDYVDLYCRVEDEHNDKSDERAVYDVTMEVEVDGAVGMLRYTEEIYDGGIGYSSYWEEKPEGVESAEWEFDKETMTLTINGETCNFTVIKDHLADTDVDTNTDIDADSNTDSDLVLICAAVDPETYEIKRLTTITEGKETIIELIDCNDVADFVDVPETVNNTISVDEAGMEITMTMFTIAMSGMGMAE